MEAEALDRFFQPETAPNKRRTLTAIERLSIPISALAGGWIVYEPLLNLVHMRGPGPGDEVTALGASIVAAALAVAASTFDAACESGPTYKQKRWLWRGSGAAGGIGLGTAVIGLDLIATGGLATLLGTTLAKIGALGLFAAGGAVGGDYANRMFSQKKCRTCGNRSRCCDKICLHCGRLFDVDRSWCDRSIADATNSVGNHLSLRDLASIFDCAGLSYLEFSAALEENVRAWADPGPSEEFCVSRRRFFEWLEVHRNQLSRYRDRRPSPEFWTLSEKAVRSDCAPDQVLDLEQIGRSRA